MSELQGQCLCGAVKVTATPAKPSIAACHCGMCQKWASGPFLSFEVETGYAALGPVRSFASSDWAERAFCGECGSALWYRFTMPGKMYGQTQMSAGLFENAGGAKLGLEIFIDEKPQGYAFDGDHARLTGAEVVAASSPSEEGESQ